MVDASSSLHRISAARGNEIKDVVSTGSWEFLSPTFAEENLRDVKQKCSQAR